MAFNADFDYKGHNFTMHSKRTALIALYLARKLKLDEKSINNIYIAAFLHDIGAVDAFAACHSNIHFIHEHCEFGAKILSKLPIDSNISEFVLFHHENYNGSGPIGSSFGEIPLAAQIIRIADTFELMYRSDKPNRIRRQDVLNWMISQKNKMFDPYLIDMLYEISEAERFWLDIENINIDSTILNRLRPKIQSYLSITQINDIAEVFAAIIDKKSRFTQLHSMGVADYTYKFSKFYNFNEEKTTKMRIAGLLHDIGKLSIPNSILDKPGKLTPDEFTIIKSHTYYTRLILSKIDNFDDICDWAANHHENLKGTGYPDRLSEKSLSLESRIMAVSDIYQALTEDRPYRKPMPKDSALKIIDDLAASGGIDGSVTKNLKEII